MTANAGAGLEARIDARRGSFSLNADLVVNPGEVLAVIGPNGAGKSTLLDVISGVLRLERGAVSVSGRVLSRAGAGRGTVDVAMAERHIGYLGQRARLFPHFTLLDNVAYGLRAQGIPRRSAESAALEWIDRVGLAGHERTRPAHLSGGQQQRGAIARTLAARPDVLLLDEPFSALDVSVSAEIRALVQREIARVNLPAILVTHELIDVIVLADEVMVFDHGSVTQHGDVDDVLRSPATAFAARFVGKQFVAGVAASTTTLRLDGSPFPLLRGLGATLVPGEPASATFDASDVRMVGGDAVAGTADATGATGATSADRAHTWVGTVAKLTAAPRGIHVETVEWPGVVAEIPVEVARSLRIGDRRTFALDERAVHLDVHGRPAQVGRQGQV